MTVLGDLSQEERDQRFALLQRRLVAVWNGMRLNLPGESIVVVPSIVPESTTEGAAMQALEERLLFLTLLLRQPRLRMIYLTSMPVAPAIIEYYLSLLPASSPAMHASASTWCRCMTVKLGRSPPSFSTALGSFSMSDR